VNVFFLNPGKLRLFLAFASWLTTGRLAEIENFRGGSTSVFGGTMFPHSSTRSSKTII